MSTGFRSKSTEVESPCGHANSPGPAIAPLNSELYPPCGNYPDQLTVFLEREEKSITPSLHSAAPSGKKISRRKRAGLGHAGNVFLWLAFFFLPSIASGGGLQPRIFFSDLESGPNSGGESNKGAYVTVYGRNFGKTQGSCTVSVGGGMTDNYPLWSEEEITFQLGAKARTGQIVVNCPQGTSNGLPFTVRPGNIYFVSTKGSDGNTGNFSSPWQTLVKAKNSMQPGDITYAMDGVSQTRMDNYGAALNIESGGALDKPLAIVAYPRAIVTVGDINGVPFGLRVANTHRAQQAKHWVIAGLQIRGQTAGLVLGGETNPSAEDWRIIGNDFTCPKGNGPAACAGTARASNIKFLGNVVHDVGFANTSKLYHGVYFGTDSSNIEVGWNHIYNIRGCRAIQFHSSPVSRDGTSGLNQYNLIVHDNLIHDVRCDAINFATVDPSRGLVQAYNNIIYHVGTGPHPVDGPSDYACFYVAGATNVGPSGSGQVSIMNNTCYDAGSVGVGYGGAGLISGPLGSSYLTVKYQNNIFYSLNNEPYLSLATIASGGAQKLQGSNNLWFGNGPGPDVSAQLSGNVNADPLFANVSTADFHLRPGSPAIRAGVKTSPATDHDGQTRFLEGSYDIGALQSPVASAPRRDHGTHP